MKATRWRVKKFVTPAAAAPRGMEHLAERLSFAVWGVWPPLWDITGQPLLYFGTMNQAMTSASRRADFAYAPNPIEQLEGFNDAG